MAKHVVYDVSKLGKTPFEQVEELFYGDGFRAVKKKEITERSRWSLFYNQVFQEVETGKYWRASWAEPATEMQETDPDLVMVLVEPKEITIIEYLEVDYEDEF